MHSPPLSVSKIPHLAWYPSSLLVGQLDALSLAICFARIDLLAGLLDGPQHGLVWEGRVGDHSGDLSIEGDIVGLYACGYVSCGAFGRKNE